MSRMAGLYVSLSLRLIVGTPPRIRELHPDLLFEWAVTSQIIVAPFANFAVSGRQLPS